MVVQYFIFLLYGNDSVLCFYCHSQESRGNLEDQKNKALAYIFKCFYNHQDSACHQAFSAYHLVIPNWSDIGEMVDNQIIKRRQMERKFLIDIIKCLKFLSRQGIALQGHDNNDNLTQTLLLLGTKDDNITKHIHGQIGHKYTHNDIQNELLSIMSSHVLRAKLSIIRERKFFSIMADGGTDVSNIAQLSFCTRSVDDDLNVSKDLWGFMS